VIKAKEIRREFRSVKKEEGWKGAVKLITKPEYVVHEALKGVSFEIPEGSFVGLIGANGAGKSTLLKILSGLIPSTSGEARVLGEDPFKRSIPFRKSIALVMGQKAQLWWDLPAIDAFELLRAIYDIPTDIYKKRVTELTDILQVGKLLNTQIRRLSLGERMKMELIGALIHLPKVVFLDEPTIGLDLLAASNLREFLKVFNQREKSTIILTSHNMNDVEKLCSRILILKEGSLIYDGSPQKLTGEGTKTLRVRLLEPVSTEQLAQNVGVEATAVTLGSGASSADETVNDEVEYFRIALSQDAIPKTIQTLLSRYTIADLGIEEVSLEHVIQNLYTSGSSHIG